MACYGWMNIVQDKGHWWAVVGISCLREELLASQEGLYLTELVSYIVFFSFVSQSQQVSCILHAHPMVTTQRCSS